MKLQRQGRPEQKNVQHFCGFGKTLDSRLEALGAKPMVLSFPAMEKSRYYLKGYFYTNLVRTLFWAVLA